MYYRRSSERRNENAIEENLETFSCIHRCISLCGNWIQIHEGDESLPDGGAQKPESTARQCVNGVVYEEESLLEEEFDTGKCSLNLDKMLLCK